MKLWISFRLITGRFSPSALSLLETRCLKTFSTFPEFPLWSVAAGFLKSGSPVVTFVALETLKMVFCRLSLLTRCFDLSNFLQSVLTTLLVVLPEFFLKNKLLIQGGNLLKWTSLEFGCYLMHLPVNCWFCYPNYLSSCVRNVVRTCSADIFFEGSFLLLDALSAVLNTLNTVVFFFISIICARNFLPNKLWSCLLELCLLKENSL